MTRTVRTVEFTVTAGSRAHCAFCRRRLAVQWSNGHRRLWACLWHTRRGWRALDSEAGWPG